MSIAGDEAPPRADRVPGAPHPAETRQLFGQQASEGRFLEAWAAGRLHHAWLLRGPRGIGKATLAYRLARALIASGLGPAPASLDAPEDCPVARRLRAGSEPRLFLLRRMVNDKTGKLRSQIVIDDVRGMRGFFGLSAPDGGWRAVIVDAADEMNPSAANALLKMLEEPPPRAMLFLVSHAPASLLPTIRSRCRVLDLAPLGAADMGAALSQAGAGIAPGAAAALAELSGGSVGRAIALATGGGLQLYARMVGMMGAGGIDRAGLAALANETAGPEAAPRLEMTADLLQTLLARLARAGATGTPAPEAAPGEAALAARVAGSLPAARLWAEAGPRTAGRIRHALAVNLDPAQTILDTFLDLDSTLAEATRG